MMLSQKVGCTGRHRPDKQEPDQLPVSNGAFAKAAASTDPVAGDDAAAPAGDQAAAAVPPRPDGLCRNRDRAQSAPRTRHRRGAAERRARARRKRERPTSRRGTPSGSPTNSRQAALRSRKISTPTSKMSSPTSRPRPLLAPRRSRKPIPTGPVSARARTTTTTTICEAFVASEPTLADHLAEQLALATSDPAERLIGHYLLDLVNEAGYLVGDPPKWPTAGRAGRESGSRPRATADLQSARRLRAQPRRMPRDPAQGARPVRSRHAGADRPPRSARQARLRGAAPLLRRRRRRPRRHDRRDPPARPQAGHSTSVRPSCNPSFPTCSCGRVRTAAGSSSSTRTRCRRCWSTRPIMRASRAAPRKRPTRPISATACRARPGSCARSTSGRRRSSRSRPRSCASRTRSSSTASSICVRSISRPSPRRSACTN